MPVWCDFRAQTLDLKATLGAGEAWMVIGSPDLGPKCSFSHTMTSGLPGANWCSKTSTESKSLHARFLILDIYDEASPSRQRSGLFSLLWFEGREESQAHDRHSPRICWRNE